MTDLRPALLVCALPLLADPPAAFRLEDLRRIVRLSDARIAPDGRRIAVVVGRPNWDENREDVELDLVDAASCAVRPLTWNRRGVASPRWSPRGDALAFLAEDPATKKPQIFLLPMAGGDPRRLTDARTGVATFTWSPDGTRLAFARQDEAGDEAAKRPAEAFKVTENHYLTRAAVQPWHVWVVPAAGGEARRLTQGPWSVQVDEESETSLAWSPDGREIAYARFPSPYAGRAFLATLEAVPAGGGAARALAPETGVLEPRYAPKGGAVAFQRPRNGDLNNGAAVYLAAGGGARDLTAGLARHIQAYEWLADGSGLVLEGPLGPQVTLWKQPLEGPAQRLDLGEVSPRGFSLAGDGTIAFVGTTADHPGELYVRDAAGGRPRRLTHFNDFADGLLLGRSEELVWEGPGGFREDGILTYPAGAVKGRAYPLVLVIHGGPAAQSTRTFDPLAQLLAARGFLVFQPNYRGSTGLGDAYQHAIFQDTCEGPGQDVMAGLEAVKRLGVVDPARIAVSGWSYGGTLTSWLNGRYPGWKAALEGAALNDWLLDYTLAFYQEGDLYFFGGGPYGKDARIARMWRDQSPIALAGSVTSPTLVLGDAGDSNVPIVNSYIMYHALRDRGVPVEFYVYPVDTHFPGGIVPRTDLYGRWVNWMAEHLR